jgi:hypothetical protein
MDSHTTILSVFKVILVSPRIVKVTILSPQSFYAAINTSTADAIVPTHSDATTSFGDATTCTNDTIVY